eukprot:4712797-Prymnesium_polylepis.1
MKVLREKAHCRSSSSIHLYYNQPLVGGLSVHPTPARQIGNLSLAGGSTLWSVDCAGPPTEVKNLYSLFTESASSENAICDCFSHKHRLQIPRASAAFACELAVAIAVARYGRSRNSKNDASGRGPYC